MDGMRGKILVLDDEPAIRKVLGAVLRCEGHQVYESGDGAEALDIVAREGCDLVIQDLRMPGMDGLRFLALLKERHPEVLSIVITAFGTWETAVEAMRLGAYDHVRKPFDTDEIRTLVARAVERRALYRRLKEQGLPGGAHVGDMVGNSPAIRAVADLVARVAPTDSTVLICGETGTGKEMVAKAFHYGSMRAFEPFVAVNCGAFPETLLESELFGHVRGAFTGAVADRKGVFELADRGTLLLDEIGEMSIQTQVKLLRVLETRTFKPVGGMKERTVDVRLIASTNRDLAAMVREKQFREDLYYRLNVIPVFLPPLRERKEDIPLLAGHFLARFASRAGKRTVRFSEGAMSWLAANPWVGNVRELENCIERAVALCDGDTIEVRHLVGPSAPVPRSAPREFRVPEGGMDLEKRMEEIERAYVTDALERAGWNLTRAAQMLGLSFRAIRYKVRRLGIERREMIP
ncbi:MAG: sigma-54 dependent transcriptional regulator [Planctomycetota bacterium]|nr:sigma-54 dependent transcriptional regulator [Planctomycetota bacterium]